MSRIARVLLDGAPRSGVIDGDELALFVEEVTPEAFVTDLDDIVHSAWAHGERVRLAGLPRLAPIRLVRNVFCVGWNYLAHFDEGRASRPEIELPEHPTFFTKATTTVTGPFDPIPAHQAITSELDWEVELAVVIGRGGVDIREEDALRHIAGYTVANDVTARDVQARHGKQWFRGKSLDGTLPLGPEFVTADEIDDPQGLTIECQVDGEVVQHASTAQMIFPVRRIIAELSAGLTLLPGDVIITGTPDGVGHQRTPARHLTSGQTLSSSISGIGEIRNRVMA